MWDEAARLVAMGLSAIEVAERLGVHVRTVRKWLAKARAMGEAPPALIPPETDHQTLDLIKTVLRREIAAVDAASVRQPGRSSNDLMKLARAVRYLQGIEPEDRPSAAGGEVSLEELRLTIARRLDGMAQAEQAVKATRET